MLQLGTLRSNKGMYVVNIVKLNITPEEQLLMACYSIMV